MVRRDEEIRPKWRRTSRCASPTGESPVPVGAGAPGSRPPPSGRDPDGEAGRRKPLRRKQARGPQHQVKPAASTEKQTGSRAGHVAAKAIPRAQVPERVFGPGGVRGAARVQGQVRNTGDPSTPPVMRQEGSYKPKAKSSIAQRESEGVVVVKMAAPQNAAGAKGLCFGHVRNEGKREGMADEIGPNNPGERWLDEEVRQPRSGLWASAKRRPCVQATSRRPSVSRMPEIGTYGLKGGSTLSSMMNNQRVKG
jgi:hypothetical protein